MILHPILGTEIDLSKPLVNYGAMHESSDGPLTMIMNLLPEEIGHSIFTGQKVDGHYLKVVPEEMGEESFVTALIDAGFVSLATLWLERLPVYVGNEIVPDAKKAHQNSKFTATVTHRAELLLNMYSEELLDTSLEHGHTILYDCADLLRYSESGYDFYEQPDCSLLIEFDFPDNQKDLCNIVFENRFRIQSACPAAIREHFDNDNGIDHGHDPEEVFIQHWTRPMREAAIKVCRQQIEFLRNLHK